MSNIDETKQCLICSETYKVMVSLRECLSECQKLSVAQVLENLNFLSISDVAKYNRSICFICVAKVQSCFEFKLLCGQTENILTTLSIKQDYEESKISIYPPIKYIDHEEYWSNDPEKTYEETSNINFNGRINLGTNNEKFRLSRLSPNLPYHNRNETNSIQMLGSTFSSEKVKDGFFGIKTETTINENGDSKKINADDALEREKKSNVEDPLSSTKTTLIPLCFSERLKINDNIFADKTEPFHFQKNITSSEENQLQYKTFDCLICHQIFITEDHLRQHSLIHITDSPFVCDICNKSFNYSSNLKKHKLVHTGKRPYTCEFCQKSFKQTHHLASHRLIHTGEKPYVCDVCNKSFNKISHLSRHKNIHIGTKSCVCDICDKAFVRADHLSSHRTTHFKGKFICNV